MFKLTQQILFSKFFGILKFVKIIEFQEFLKFIKFEFSIYGPNRAYILSHSVIAAAFFSLSSY